MDNFERGDHLVSPRTGYRHHGLYLGKHLVIHYTGSSDNQHDGRVAITNLAEFDPAQRCSIRQHPTRRYDRETSIRRALSRLGEAGYSVLGNNCEHFIHWCIDGSHRSRQVETAVAAASTIPTIVQALELDSIIPKKRSNTAWLLLAGVSVALIVARRWKRSAKTQTG